jgi:tape measure domain-containing protein
MLVRIAADTAGLRSEMQSAQNAVGSAVTGIKNTVMGLVGAFGGIALADKFIEVADAVTLMDARLKLAVGAGADLAKAQQDIYDISQRAGVGLQETTALYTKLYDPVKRLGGGIKENTAIVEAFSASLKVGGASTQEAAAATMQFAQAMGSGKLQGDEFRSIAEASPRFMKALADGMGVPIEQLKKLGSEGKLTADIVGNALMKSLGQLKSEMGSIPDTFGAAAQRFTNDVVLAVGELNKAAGATLGLAGAVEEARKLIPAVKDELAGAFQAVSEWIERNREGLGQAWEVTKSFLADAWEVAKAFGRVAGAVSEWLVQSGTLKTVLEVLRLLVAGFVDGVDIVAAAFAKAGAYLLDFVGIFSDSAKSAAEAAHAAADATFKRFGEGKTAVGALNEEMARNATRTAQAKDALASHGLTAAENSNEMARLTGRTGSQSEALVTLKNKNAEATEEQKKAADALKKAQEAADAYNASLSQQIGTLQKQITLGRELTEVEKEQDKLTEQLRSGKVMMTAAEEAGARAKVEYVAQLKTQIEQTKLYEKSVRDAEEEVYKARVKAGEEAYKQADAISSLLDKAKEENETIGKTKAQLDALENARLLQQRTILAEKVALDELLDYCNAETEARKEQFAALDQYIDARERNAALKTVTAIEEETAKIKEQNDAYGKTTQQLEQLETARLVNLRTMHLESAAAMELTGASLVEVAAHEKIAAALKNLIEEREKGTHIKAAVEAADEWKKTADSINNGLTDALMRGFESGKDFFQTFKDTLVNAFKTLVLQPTIKMIMAPVSGALGSLFSGNAMAGTGGGSIGGVLSSLGNLFNGTTINNSIGGAFNSFATSNLGSKLGLSAPIDYGTGFASNVASPMSNMIGSGLGMLGNGMAGFGISSALSGGYSLGGKNLVNGIAGIASAIPGIGPIAGVVGGLINRAFGLKAKELKDAGIEGTITGGDATGQRYQDWFQKGGWFRKNKSGTDRSELGDDLSAALDLGASGILNQTKAWAAALKLPADTLAQVTLDFKTKLTGNAEEDKAAIELVFQGYQNKLTEQFDAVLEPFQQAGETIADTMGRLVALAEVTESLNSLGGIFSTIATSSIEARENIIALAGGIENLMAISGQFVADYYTAQEQIGLTAKGLKEQLEAAGVTAAGDLSNKEEFRKLVESVDVSTTQGQELVVTLLQLAPEFARLTEALKTADIEGSLAELADKAPNTAVLDSLLPEAQSTTAAIGDVAEQIKAGNDTLAKIEKAISDGNVSIATGLAALAVATQNVANLQAQVAANTAATAAATTSAATGAALNNSSPTYTADVGANSFTFSASRETD